MLNVPASLRTDLHLRPAIAVQHVFIYVWIAVFHLSPNHPCAMMTGLTIVPPTRILQLFDMSAVYGDLPIVELLIIGDREQLYMFKYAF